ncbi:hypothetical protein DPMN_053774 [Dreissena polymorpha]|uniref:Uncharacterized protein n=1 Tax=Dreissena polymorpha TaxID=45954 RepID=A0A9D4CNF9_DREPO|nr:hypothetical protein DPMN_053774 [Dreissena polymorpha]
MFNCGTVNMRSISFQSETKQSESNLVYCVNASKLTQTQHIEADDILLDAAQNHRLSPLTFKKVSLTHSWKLNL